MADTVKFHPGRAHSDTVQFFNCETFNAEAVRNISRVTWVGVVMNVTLAVLKAVGGVLGGSTALLADAVHTVSDLATDAAILIGVRYWSAPADADHPHGHRKIETLVTLAIGGALAAVGLGMGYGAVTTLTRAMIGHIGEGVREMNLASWLALGAAVASIVGKELLYRWTVAKGVELSSSAVVANAWHHRSDAFSSIPPALAIGGEALATRLGYNLWFLDPVGTLVVCVMLLQAAWEVIQPTLGTLLDQSADRKVCSAIRQTILATRGVMGAHRIRTRVIGAKAVAVDLHISVDRELTVREGHEIAATVKYAILGLKLEENHRAVDVMVHVEPADAEWDKVPACPAPGSDTLVDWRQRDGSSRKSL